MVVLPGDDGGQPGGPLRGLGACVSQIDQGYVGELRELGQHIVRLKTAAIIDKGKSNAISI